MANRSHFRRGKPVFNCDVCGRRTRNPDSDAICSDCWELAGIDNHYNDTGTAPDDVQIAFCEGIVAGAVRRGSDGDAMRKACPFIWRVEQRDGAS